MTEQSKPSVETPKVSEALTSDLADLLRALAYTTDTGERVRLTRIAKTFIAEHQDALGGHRAPAEYRTRAWQIDDEWMQGLWKRTA